MDKRIIKIASIPKPKTKPHKLLGLLCYYYPQYTYAQARKIPYKTVSLLLDTAEKQKATEYMHLLQIASAVRGKDGGKSLHKHYKSLAGG